MLNIVIWSLICINLSGIICYHMGIDAGKVSEAEKWMKKCEKCGKDGVNSID